jgi:hypothetical protein
MPKGRGYKGWGQRRLAKARSAAAVGGGTKTRSVKGTLSGRAWAMTRGRGRKVGLRRQTGAPPALARARAKNSAARKRLKRIGY